MSAHGQTATHWLPQPDTESGITACGLDIDGSCDRHRAEGKPCSGYGLAWTLSRDLASYQNRPYESWPPPCPVCQAAAKAAGGQA